MVGILHPRRLVQPAIGRVAPRSQQHPRLSSWWKTSRPFIRLCNGTACILLMWRFLYLFTQYRSDVALKAGDSDGDTSWSFGQVLSLATWVPVGVDLVAVYICESSSAGGSCFVTCI